VDRADAIRLYLDAWNTGDVESTIDLVDPGVIVDWSESNAPYRGIYHGLDGYRGLYADLIGAFAGARAEAHEIVEVGDRVAVANTAHLSGRDGIEVIARSTIVLTFRGDRIVELKLFQEHGDALRAIGAPA
jgi:ketosteroid isomerase-like protein